MRRIVGLTSPAPCGVREGALGPALDAVRRNERDPASVVSAAGATLVATGPPGGTAEFDGLLVAMDGRIYNRDELGVPDHDPTALALMIRRHGPAGAARRLNADLAAAVYEPATRTLWLIRDRFGLRPLYWCPTPEGAAFSSRPRALFALAGESPTPDPQYLARVAGSHYRTFDNDPGRSPYRGIHQVPAAHVTTIATEGSGHERYWAPADFPEPPTTEPAELATLYRDLLSDAVERRVAATDRPAFTLSGGMDSSSVLACAARRHGPQRAYSTVYDDPTFDERNDILPMLGERADPWRPVAVRDQDVLAMVERMVAEQDEPVATATWLSHRVLADAAAGEGVTALLGGLGGDELNAGEYEYFPFHFADLRRAGREDRVDAEIAAWSKHHDHPVHRKSPEVAETLMRHLTDGLGGCRPDLERLGRYAHALAPDLAELALAEPAMEHPFDDHLANRCWQDLTRETLPCCLRAEDRTMAAVGMERMHPFLDHRLVELMFQIPGEQKIREGVTKRLLREAMRSVLPEETRTRVTKTGWNAPAHRWFSGAALADLRDLVASRRFRERGVYRAEEVERLIDDHVRIVGESTPRENHMMFLWQLVNVEMWLRELDGSSTPTRESHAALT